MEFVYFAACNFKTTYTWEYFRGFTRISEWNKSQFKNICLRKLFSSYCRQFEVHKAVILGIVSTVG